MKINFWNHEFFTTYTTHAICFLEVDQATDQAKVQATAEAKAQATDHAKDQAPDHAKGKGKGAIKKKFFVSFPAQHFLWHKEHSFIFICQKVDT